MAALVLVSRSRSHRSLNDRVSLVRWTSVRLTRWSLLTLCILVSSNLGCRSSRVVKLKSLESPIATAPTPPPAATDPKVAQATHLDPFEPVAPAPQQTPADALPSESMAEAKSIADAIQNESPSGLTGPASEKNSGATNGNGTTDGNNEQVLKQKLNAQLLDLPPPEPDAQKQPGMQTESTAQAGPTELALEDVIASATERFPSVREATLLRALAIGDQINAMGEFDDKLEAYSINQPLSFYENYRHGVGIKHPLYMGGTAYAGYRLGRGEFEPWYKERETNEGGEFKAGLNMPLLRDRAIDYRRTAVRIATLEIQKSNPQLFQQVLQTQLEATNAYWNWYSAAKQHEVAQQLMSIAEKRVDQIEKQIAAGDVARIVGIDNSRLLTMRRAKLIEAKQKLDIYAIKLSLYHRDEFGRPIQASANTKPINVPAISERVVNVSDEISRAQLNRPELQQLNLMEQQLRAELRLAINQRLPEVSFGTEVSQDVGGLASSSGDKQPLILEAGLTGSVPIQRRKAIGKAQSLRAKVGQLDAKRQLTSEKIANDVREAATMYEAAHLRLEQARLNKQLAQQTLTAGGISFNSGDIDILMLNIYEQAFADAGLEIIHAEVDVLIAEAMLQVATGRSLIVDEVLPPLINELPL